MAGAALALFLMTPDPCSRGSSSPKSAGFVYSCGAPGVGSYGRVACGCPRAIDDLGTMGFTTMVLLGFNYIEMYYCATQPSDDSSPRTARWT